MFNKKIKADLAFLEVKKTNLEKELRRVKDELADTKHKKKLEEEDIKHMVKMSKEANEIKLQKSIMDKEKEKQEAIAAVKDTYRDKMEERLQTEVTNIKEMYSDILERLPNINVKMKGDV